MLLTDKYDNKKYYLTVLHHLQYKKSQVWISKIQHDNAPAHVATHSQLFSETKYLTTSTASILPRCDSMQLLDFSQAQNSTQRTDV